MASRAAAVEMSFTVLPNATIKYRADGKHVPTTYINHFNGISSPLYRLEFRQTPSRKGYWGMSLLHTGDFGGGEYSPEVIVDNTTGGVYQRSLLNVGFINASVTYRRAVKEWPIEALFNLSVVRGFFKRKEVIIQGVDLRPQLYDDVNEVSAEGFGIGLAGRHSLAGAGKAERFYGRWQTSLNYYVQIADAKTDASFGQIFQMEGGLGARVWRGLSLELGGFRQYWFMPSPARRVTTPTGAGLIMSWDRQETWAHGAYLRLSYDY